MTTKLFVGNLPASCDKYELKTKFEKYGVVTEFDILSNYGFVHFQKASEASAACDALSGSTFMGNEIRVELSTSRVRQKAGMGDKDGCYRCGKPGHWSKDCPRGGPGRRPMKPGGYGRDPYDDPYLEDPYADPYYRDRYMPPPYRYDPYYDPYDRRPYPPMRDPYRDRYADPYATRAPPDYYRRSPPAPAANDPYGKEPLLPRPAAASDPYAQNPKPAAGDPYADPYAAQRADPYAAQRADPYAAQRADPYADPYAAGNRTSDPYADPYAAQTRASDPYAAAPASQASYSADPYGESARSQTYAGATAAKDPYADPYERKKMYPAATRPAPYARPAAETGQGGYQGYQAQTQGRVPGPY